MSAPRYHHIGETWRDPEYGARFGFGADDEPEIERRSGGNVVTLLTGMFIGCACTLFWVGLYHAATWAVGQ